MDAFNKGEMRSMLQLSMNINFDSEETQAVIFKYYFMLFCSFPLLPHMPFFPKEKLKQNSRMRPSKKGEKNRLG